MSGANFKAQPEGSIFSKEGEYSRGTRSLVDPMERCSLRAMRYYAIAVNSLSLSLSNARCSSYSPLSVGCFHTPMNEEQHRSG